MNNPIIPAVGSVWNCNGAKLRIICNDRKAEWSIIGLVFNGKTEDYVILNPANFYSECIPWTDAPAVGTLEWAEALPVGSRVTTNRYHPNFMTRKKEGWSPSEAPHLTFNRLANWYSNRDGWSIVTSPIITDWPKWAKAAAMDGSGRWHWYDGTPRPIGANYWVREQPNFVRAFHPTEIPDWSGDWKDSLVVKP